MEAWNKLTNSRCILMELFDTKRFFFLKKTPPARKSHDIFTITSSKKFPKAVKTLKKNTHCLHLKITSIIRLVIHARLTKKQFTFKNLAKISYKKRLFLLNYPHFYKIRLQNQVVLSPFQWLYLSSSG